MNIIDNSKSSNMNGFDFIVDIKKKDNDSKIKILQLTDMQIIDAWQRRTFDRIRTDEINAWSPENFDIQFGNHARSLVAQANPDIIFITGDMVYGSFDDNGTTFKWFCEFMDSFEIPWAPTFGNHDNESKKGVEWQCEQFKNSKYCMFEKGNVSGNSNYSVGIFLNGKPVRVLHMLDSNGCKASEDPLVIKESGIYPDQVESIKEKTKLIKNEYKTEIPAFLAFHIPVKEFEMAEINNGYKTDSREFYVIGADVPKSNDNDFGFKLETFKPIQTTSDFLNIIKKCNIDGVFVGHVHSACTSMEYEGIRWTFGLKTGQYDYHIPGQLGGTLIQLEDDKFEVHHIPSLVHYAPFPGGADMFDNFFSEDKKIFKDSY